MKTILNPKERKALAQALVEKTAAMATRKIRLMEVCGTHTVSIFRAGIRQLLPENVELVSGPGCPVCVTPNDYMDKAIFYAQQPDVILATFGDMLKVPGSRSSLAAAKAQGADIRIVYSPLDCLKIAEENPAKKVVFLAVGFETTAPTVAATVLAAGEKGLKNFFLLTSHKLTPPAVEALLNSPDVKVDGFILPGHVCVVTGEKVFGFIGEKYGLPAVVTGFEPLDILQSIYMLVKARMAGEPLLANEYARVVTAEGNLEAQKLMGEVFTRVDATWRGIGAIPASGLALAEAFAPYDIEKIMPPPALESKEPTLCRCGEVLRGVIQPTACSLFGKACTPEHAVGACMVSVEGTCAAWYKYGGRVFNFK